MGKLYVGSADDTDGFHNGVCLFFQTVLYLLGNRQHRSGTEGITCMYTHGINIFYETNGDFFACCIADNFHFQLFPSDNRLFNENLVHHGCRNTAGCHFSELFLIIYNTAAGTAHGVGRTDDTGISKLGCNLHCLLNGVSRCALSHLNAQFVHGLF